MLPALQLVPLHKMINANNTAMAQQAPASPNTHRTLRRALVGNSRRGRLPGHLQGLVDIGKYLDEMKNELDAKASLLVQTETELQTLVGACC